MQGAPGVPVTAAPGRVPQVTPTEQQELRKAIDDAALREVITASLLEHAPRGLIHANMATISVALAESLAHAHASRSPNRLRTRTRRAASITLRRR